MLLTAVIILLREVLEGALLLSVLLALSRLAELKLFWVFPAIAAGLLGAVLYAANLEPISEWFDYVGQEVVNASLQISIFIALLLFLGLHGWGQGRFNRSRMLLMIAIVALAITRETGEIILYLSGYVGKANGLVTVLVGGAIGAGIGLSVGAILYYTLTYFLVQRAQLIAHILLGMFAGNILSQATLMLIQADWLSAHGAVWDTSGWLPEDTILGQLLYAVVGYEATPSSLQLYAYVGGMSLVWLLAYLVGRGRRRDE
jgi:high-affinity iron transporter